MIVSGDIRAYESNGRAPGATTDRFNLSGIEDSMSGAEIEVVSPPDSVTNSIEMTYLNTSMTFRLMTGVTGSLLI